MKLSNHKWMSFFLALGGLCLGGCFEDPAGWRSESALAGTLCGESGACGRGLECEIEHGVGVCRPHGSAGDGSVGSATAGGACTGSVDCTSGLECEIEHGIGTCRAHGGGAGEGTGAVSPGGACVTSADCSGGLECEVEHGVSVCKEHGGRRR
jgi:hypothetical protein